MRTYIGSPGAPLQRAHTANSTATSFTAPAATATKPSGAGVLDFCSNPPSWLKLLLFGTGNDNDTFDARLIGWSIINSLWVPTILLQCSATLSAFVGVSGGDVTDSERFADTLSDPVSGMGSAGVDCQKHSPANDTPAFYLLDACGCTLFRLDIDRTGATAGNGLLGSA